MTELVIVFIVLVIAGVVFTYAQLRATQDQLELDREAQLTERQAQAEQRLLDAVRQIEAPTETEQILGISALRSIAADEGVRGNVSYYAILDDTLSRFVRDRAPCRPCPAEPRPPDRAVQVALEALGAERQGEANLTRNIDLQYTDLRGLNLRGLYFVRADFRHSNLSEADLTGAHLEGVDLQFVIFAGTTGRDQAFFDDQTKWS